ncbi:MAG: lysozyme inhibitor LprI family protein [Pseudolabrys sp.]
MLWIVSIAAAVLIGAAAFAYAGDQGDPDQSCDGSTYEIVECLRAKTVQWDNRMTTAYQRMLNAGEPKQREQLRVAQRLWIQYRDANCLYYGLGEGTIARVEAGDCMLRMTQSRAIELEGKEDRN